MSNFFNSKLNASWKNHLIEGYKRKEIYLDKSEKLKNISNKMFKSHISPNKAENYGIKIANQMPTKNPPETHLTHLQ